MFVSPPLPATETPVSDEVSQTEHPFNCSCLACRERDGFEDDVARSTEPVDGGADAAASVATLQEMADFLEIGYWNNGTGLRHNLGSTGLDPNNGVLYYNVTGHSTLTYGGGSDLDGVSADRAALIRDAFDLYEAVLGITFIETTNTDDSVVDFFFSDDESGAYAGSTRYNDGTIYYSYINIASGWSGGTSTYDDYTLQTIFHEIGHALGLGHQGPYNGSASYSSDAIYEIDSWQSTMMSYFSQFENSAISASTEFLQTPMAVDWIALDDIYGQWGFSSANAFTGDTTYGFNTNITASESAIWNDWSNWADRTASTIVDGGGIDTIDVSGYGANQTIDLTIQNATQTSQDSSDIGGRIGNLTLAVGTVIENATTGAGNDTLIGNTADNVLRGGAGNDTLIGMAGNDSLHGDAGIDTALFNLTFASYAFEALDSAIEVIGEGIDFVYDTIETLQFSDISYSFTDILGTFSSAAPMCVDDMATVGEDAALTLDVLANDSDEDGDTLTITEINSEAIAVGGSVTLASGAIVTLNDDGTLDYDQNGAFDALAPGETGEDLFTYTATDGFDNFDSATVSIDIVGAGDGARVIGQSGTETVTQTTPDLWHSVTFDAAIENAVVVMGPVSLNDADPLTTRVRNVTDTGFEFQIDEWEYLDGIHGTETVSWLAMSEGTHTLASGQEVVAGTSAIGRNFTEVSFGTTLTDAVVLSEVTTVNEADAVTTRMRRVTETTFDVQIQEEQARGRHVIETVSWIAFETGADTGIDVFLTGDEVDEQIDTFTFNTSFSTAPVLLGDFQSRDNIDTTTLRMSALDATSVSLFAEEEQSGDAEVDHTDETAGYVALEAGLIYDGSNAAPTATDDVYGVTEEILANFDVLANDSDPDGDMLYVTAIDGQAIGIGGSVTLDSGASVTLLSDGTLDYTQNGIFSTLSAGDIAGDSFTYSISDSFGGTATAEAQIVISGSSTPEGPEAIGQSGSVSVSQTDANEWHNVTFDATITDAVVVMGPISSNQGAAALTRLRNVTDTGFEFQIDEWEYQDGVHDLETISWLAISEGMHSLTGGQIIVAGNATVGTTLTDVSYGGTLTDAIVLTEVTSVNEADAVTTRVRDVDGEGFSVQLQEEEALGDHVDETVSWIAIETGTSLTSDVFEIAPGIDHLGDTFTFTPSFGSAPVLLADMQTTAGTDTATLRLTDLDATEVSLFVQEEKSADKETSHTNLETVGVFATVEGLIYEEVLSF